MTGLIASAASQLNVPVWLLVITLLWAVFWKAAAWWKSARNNHILWFIIFFFVHTLGILEILYILLFSKINFPEINKKKKKKANLRG